MNESEKAKMKVAAFTAYCMAGLALLYWASQNPDNVRQVHIKLASCTQKAALYGSDKFRFIADAAGTYAAKLKVDA
jgi:hypothetical protein